jgi:hypothetical protein
VSHCAWPSKLLDWLIFKGLKRTCIAMTLGENEEFRGFTMLGVSIYIVVVVAR